MSFITSCIFHIQHGFAFVLILFDLPLLIFLTLFSTVGHLLTRVHLDQFAAQFVGMVSSVATVLPWAVMCAGDTTLSHHFTDTVRDRSCSYIAESYILLYLCVMHVLPFCDRFRT